MALAIKSTHGSVTSARGKVHGKSNCATTSPHDDSPNVFGILMVDFPLLPRIAVKKITFDQSLMDLKVAVGSIVLMGGVGEAEHLLACVVVPHGTVGSSCM